VVTGAPEDPFAAELLCPGEVRVVTGCPVEPVGAELVPELACPGLDRVVAAGCPAETAAAVPVDAGLPWPGLVRVATAVPADAGAGER
jgi:hypothetical protein